MYASLDQENINNTLNFGKKSFDKNFVYLKVEGDYTKVSGNTYNYRHIFNEYGGKWDKSIVSWIIPTVNNELVIEHLNSHNQLFEVIPENENEN